MIFLPVNSGMPYRSSSLRSPSRSLSRLTKDLDLMLAGVALSALGVCDPDPDPGLPTPFPGESTDGVDESEATPSSKVRPSMPSLISSIRVTVRRPWSCE